MILTRQQLEERLNEEFPAKLVITPIIRPRQIDELVGAVDVCLGQQFIVAERAALDAIDPMKKSEEIRYDLSDYLQSVHVPIGCPFILHPRQFALGATLEYIRLPKNIAAYVTGRSRWARVGLVIAMATFVHPGFAGCLTLELQNLGDIPIRLYPATPIAQIVLHSTEDETEEVTPRSKSQFSCAIGPEFPELINDEERKIIDLFRSC